MFYEMDLRVDSRDVDMFNQCRPSAVLGLLQEAATQAAMELGLAGPRLLEKYNGLWMVSRIWVQLDAPLRWNDSVTIRTWHRGAFGASVYRDFDLFRDGKPVGQAVTIWVVVDAGSRKLLRLRGLSEMEGTDGGALKKPVKLHRLSMPNCFERRARRDMNYSDTDINGHVNNIHYADFACDALHLESLGRGGYVRSFQIDYLSECRAGEALWIDTAQRDGALYAKGTGEDGSERFDFTMTLAPFEA